MNLTVCGGLDKTSSHEKDLLIFFSSIPIPQVLIAAPFHTNLWRVMVPVGHILC
ncbi:hypothetical protein LZ31DRAFT_549698 [Colletotrichum somersetense]|nr:hypothetical protein LZ31DRAFT_549698 [Colletotrichum somersetense]